MTESVVHNLHTLVTNEEQGFYRIVLKGKASLDDIIKVSTEIALFADTSKELWVINELELDFSSAEIQSLAEMLKSNPYKPAKVAIVIDNDLLFGLGRIFSSYREDDDTTVQIYRREAEALDWLGIDQSLTDINEISHSQWRSFSPCSQSNPD
jgi:hypothetical protein